MTNESMRDLQINTVIGMTEERGPAWHRRDDLLKDGEESNHYPRFIPVADVKRRIFGWEPNTVPVAYLVPCEVDKADYIRADGVAVRVVESKQGREGVLRGDNDYDMGVFMGGTIHPPYQETLIRDVEIMVGDQLGISSAGVLAKGARAWVETSLPETFHDDKSGFSYRPNVVKATSMDGSLANTTARTVTATVCDNTLSYNLLEAGRAGLLFKRKHTSLSLADIQQERDALAIINDAQQEFERELHSMIETTVTDKKFSEFLFAYIPKVEDAGRAQTLSDNRREQFTEVYTSDPMCSPWKGTAWGVLQTANTIEHHYANVRGTGRSERNTWRVLNGKQAAADREVIKVLESVLA